MIHHEYGRSPINSATRTTAATLGTIFGLSGMTHGFFASLQGNTATGGYFIAAIGEVQRMWPHGSEYAFTLIPNFLVTGIAAMLIGLLLMIWSIGFLHRRLGSTMLLLLFVLLLLTGGGIAQILFFPWIWLLATRIRSPLTRIGNILPAGIFWQNGRIWRTSLIACSALLVFVLQIAVTGFVPFVNDPAVVLAIMLASLAGVAVLFPVTFLAGFSYDLAARSGGQDQ